MSKMINIGGHSKDTSHRYQMNALQTKVEGRGNGIKTILLNITTIAKQLHTEPIYITKFFAFEVGATSDFKKKRDVGIVNGKHQRNELQSMLNKYITEFILCPHCKLPELHYKIKQKRLRQRCASCGWQGTNSSNHRVKNYMINHPSSWPPAKPKQSEESPSKSSSKQNKKDRQKQKQKEQEREEKVDINEQFAELGGNNDEVWSVDISLEAVAKRNHQEMARLALKGKNVDRNLNRDDKEKKVNRNRMDNSAAMVLRNFVSSGDHTTSEILDEIKRIALARRYHQKEKIGFTMDALCRSNTLDEFIESLRRYKCVFASFARNTEDAKLFMGVLEQNLCKTYPEGLLKKVYKILECVYDEDICEEQDILLWADLQFDQALFVDADQAEMIRLKARPFIQWLMENGEDDEEGEED